VRMGSYSRLVSNFQLKNWWRACKYGIGERFT
jgi:hypothetical protein